MPEQNLGSTKQFVPRGVDVQSWISFEHRIRERRFKALVEIITGAVARRDGVAARAALEEAQELRPSAPELDHLAVGVALLPTAVSSPASAVPSPPSSVYLWYRGLGAVAVLVVGIGLVIVIGRFGPGSLQETAASVIASPSPAVESETAPVDAPEPAPAPVPVDLAVAVKTPAAVAEPVGTASVSRASTANARPSEVLNPATFPLTGAEAANGAGGPPPEPVVQASREIPDDVIATGARIETRPGFTDVITAGSAIAANVMPQPVSVTAPPPPLPTTTASAGTSAILMRSDNTRVAQVLNQFASAFHRLDASAARAVWPTVDERALTRAFASLESQDVSFDRCDIDVKGDLASASCRGTASYVVKIGNRQARTEPRQWNFELKLRGDDWKIEKAQATAR